MMKIIYFLVFSNVVLANNNLLKNFKICSRSDPNLNDCLKGAIQKALQFLQYGVPEFNIPSMEPFEIPQWTVKKSGSVTFDQNYKNVRTYNHASSVINTLNATITDTQLIITLSGVNPMYKMVAFYNYSNANLLGVDFSGHGTFVFIHFGNEFSMNITGRVVKEKDRTKLLITLLEFDLDIEKMDVTFENRHLEISKAKSGQANKYGLQSYKELQRGYSEMYAHTYKVMAESVFSQTDFDSVFPK